MTKHSKVGILTHYYKSVNYGGNLQAYALCRFINETISNVSAEQVSYDIYKFQRRNYREYSFIDLIKKFHSKIKLHLGSKINHVIRKNIYEKIDERKKLILDFNQNNIPHSVRVYNRFDINECNSEYSIFITGSDQVWNPNVFCSAYLLSFVHRDKIKFSYSASISKSSLDDATKKIFKKTLKDYADISVREKDAVELLSDISPVRPKWVLDPVFLLTREQWDTICANRIEKRAYLFCYFLGYGKEMRNIAKEYAKEKKLKIVTLPHLLGEYRKCDLNFGDEQLYEVSPADFISLIKYADCIFTDSFHAAAFSGIYEKEYFVFERVEAKDSSSRIYSLLSLYEAEERFCDTKEKKNILYILGQKQIDYTKTLEKLEEMRKNSIYYLEKNLKM